MPTLTFAPSKRLQPMLPAGARPWSDARCPSGDGVSRSYAQPRVIILTDDLLALMQRRWAARQYQTREGIALSARVFRRRGRPIIDFRDAWAEACKKAQVPGLLFHDLRRSAVRNLEKAGVSQSVAMKISGHKTDSVYRRYRIVDERDIERALTATQESLRQAPRGNGAEMHAVREKRS